VHNRDLAHGNRKPRKANSSGDITNKQKNWVRSRRVLMLVLPPPTIDPDQMSIQKQSILVASVVGYASQKCRGPLRRFSLQGKVSTPPAAYAI